jgi:membrane protease YdiL (CAAX protease family)
MSVDAGPAEPMQAPEGNERTHRWRGRDISFFGFVFIALNLIVPGAASFLPVRGGSAEAIRVLIGTLAVQLIVIGFIVVLVRNVYGLSFAHEMRWTRSYTIRNGSLVIMGMALAFAVMIGSSLFPPNSPPIERLLNTPQAVAMFAIYAVFFAPILEEVMFRGFLFGVVEQMAGASVAVRTTAVVFALLHVPQLWGSWAGMLVIFFVGFLLSEVRRRTDSLIPSVIVHTSYNGMIFVAFLIGSWAQGGMPI